VLAIIGVANVPPVVRGEDAERRWLTVTLSIDAGNEIQGASLAVMWWKPPAWIGPSCSYPRTPSPA
jgi:hypothetical protein